VPTYNLNHLVKERYPRFVDALSDVDDALTLVYLFAALPSENTIKARVTNKAKSLAAAWGAYCSTTYAITKSFISVKGIYMEATIRGTIIRWVVPHSFTQFLPEDVDYKVMQTFFEFYETLLDFVLFKLYSDIGVRYPMTLEDPRKMIAGSKSALLGANLQSLKNALNSSSGAIGDAVTKSVEKSSKESAEDDTAKPKATKKSKELIKSVGEALSKVDGENSDGGEDEDDEDNTDVAGPLKVALESLAAEEDRTAGPGAKGEEAELDDDAMKRKHLFAGLTFFLSREIPRGYLELVCLAYGGAVGWEGDDSPITAKDPKITHHIVDRPKLPSSYNGLPKSREFVQPQWIIDCSNFMYILPLLNTLSGLPYHPICLLGLTTKRKDTNRLMQRKSKDSRMENQSRILKLKAKHLNQRKRLPPRKKLTMNHQTTPTATKKKARIRMKTVHPRKATRKMPKLIRGRRNARKRRTKSMTLLKL